MARVRASLPSGTGSPISSPGTRRPDEAQLFPEDVYRGLHQARTIGGGMSVDYRVGWRTPIIGHLWMIVRRRVHQEIRIYIDALTTQQSNLNTHVVRTLAHIVEALDGFGLPSLKRQQQAQGDALAALQEEVRALRAQVETLQERITALESRPG